MIEKYFSYIRIFFMIYNFMKSLINREKKMSGMVFYALL